MSSIESSVDPDKEDKKFKNYLKFSGMAFQMTLTIGTGAWGGRALDQKYQNDEPIWTIILSLLGIAISLYLVIRSTRKISEDD